MARLPHVDGIDAGRGGRKVRQAPVESGHLMSGRKRND